MTDQPQTNTLENPGPFDALVKLRPGEPYFPLIGRDRSAPALVQRWADGHREKTLREFADGIIDAPKRDLELEQATEAEGIGWAMVAYKRKLDRGDVDDQLALPTDKPTYSGAVLPEDTAKRDAEQRARAASIAALHNAIAELTNARAVFRANGDRKEVKAHAAMIDRLRGYVRHLTPERPGIAG